jgi:NAD(P)-dependent dehydrogenase (short-subunit alcohol dehydrogenase family)
MSTTRTAVITGATSDRGIGMTVAQRYARGWAVVILDLDGEKSAKVAADIGNQFAVPAFGHTIDVTSEESVTAAYDAVAAEVSTGSLPPVEALANIAGITSPVPFLETTLDLWNKVMAVNATGTYLVTKAFLPDMIEHGWGRIVNMSSVSAQRGGGVFGKVPYSSAKAAILGFTKALAREIADTGVTVNAITPGAVDTTSGSAPLLRKRPSRRRHPDRPVASTDEIAAVTFLSSQDAVIPPEPPLRSTAAATFTRYGAFDDTLFNVRPLSARTCRRDF